MFSIFGYSRNQPAAQPSQLESTFQEELTRLDQDAAYFNLISKALDNNNVENEIFSIFESMKSKKYNGEIQKELFAKYLILAALPEDSSQEITTNPTRDLLRRCILSEIVTTQDFLKVGGDLEDGTRSVQLQAYYRDDFAYITSSKSSTVSSVLGDTLEPVVSFAQKQLTSFNRTMRLLLPNIPNTSIIPGVPHQIMRDALQRQYNANRAQEEIIPEEDDELSRILDQNIDELLPAEHGRREESRFAFAKPRQDTPRTSPEMMRQTVAKTPDLGRIDEEEADLDLDEIEREKHQQFPMPTANLVPLAAPTSSYAAREDDLNKSPNGSPLKSLDSKDVSTETESDKFTTTLETMNQWLMIDKFDGMTVAKVIVWALMIFSLGLVYGLMVLVADSIDIAKERSIHQIMKEHNSGTERLLIKKDIV